MAITKYGSARLPPSAKTTTQAHVLRRGDMDTLSSQHSAATGSPGGSRVPDPAAQTSAESNTRMLRMLRTRDKQADSTSLGEPDTNTGTTPTTQTQQNASEVEDRFWNETSTPAILPAPTPIPSSKKSASSAWNYRKPSIAAATIIGILVLAAICFLSFYYIRRERRRARRLRRLQTQNQSRDPFGQSSLSLNAETSKTLDDFLMKDVQPERTSLMFSRSRSPSITFVVEETGRRSIRNSYDASAPSLHKLETLARVSNDRTRWSSRGSEHSSSSLRESQSISQSTGPTSGPVSASSTGPPTARLPQMCVTSTTDTPPSTTTEESSLLSPEEPASSKTSYSISRDSDVAAGPRRPNPGTSLVQSPSNASRSSHASSRLSAHSIIRSDPRVINNAGRLRRSHSRSRSNSLSQSNISPIAESTEGSSALGGPGQLPSVRSTPSPLFRFSEG